MTKKRANWTFDKEVIERVKRYASMLSRQTGVEVSQSAAANKLLRERLDQLRSDGGSHEN